MFSVVDTSPYSWYKFSRNEKNVPICLEILWRHSCSPVSADLNMNNNSTEGDFSLNEFFADLLANNNNRTDIENHTFQNFFSSECGNIPDVERIEVRDNIKTKKCYKLVILSILKLYTSKFNYEQRQKISCLKIAL